MPPELASTLLDPTSDPTRMMTSPPPTARPIPRVAPRERAQDRRLPPSSLASRGERLREARALEFCGAPVVIGVHLGDEGIQGLERTLDRSAVGGRLRGEEAHLRQRDVAG